MKLKKQKAKKKQAERKKINKKNIKIDRELMRMASKRK